MENEDTMVWCASKAFEYESLGSFDKSDTIYHYTSPQGLLGILENKEITFWFSRYDCMNDISEGKNVLEIYKDVCEELINEKNMDNDFVKAIKGIEVDEKELFVTYSKDNKMFNAKSSYAEKYICCFSKNQDSLPMWNYYTKAGRCEGYNIGVSFFETQHKGIQEYFGKDYSFRLYRVIYNEDDKKSVLRKEIEECYEKYKSGFVSLNSIKTILIQLLNNCSLIFKNNSFRHEEEIRAVITIPKESKERRFDIKYRPVNGYIVPYIEGSFPKEIISEITIGPLLKDKIALNTMNDLLKSRGYDSVEVFNSDIPIRY